MIHKNSKIVCLGGGTGTVNLVKGLKDHCDIITVVISTADEGGSSGRLRKLYDILPPGDMVSCMAALSKDDNNVLSQLLTYRFPGDRYGDSNNLGGHKLGNLIMVGLRDVTGSFETAVVEFQRIFNIQGEFLPATKENITISAKTIDGGHIIGEEKIDLGQYDGEQVLESVSIHPNNPTAPQKVIDRILGADLILAGPGDLYTTLLPVLIVPDIQDAVKKSKAKKVFIINVANKPFETKDYHINDYVKAVTKHLQAFPFDIIIANDNFSIPIPESYSYSYVSLEVPHLPSHTTLVHEDLVDEVFPLFHDPAKLAKAISKAV